MCGGGGGGIFGSIANAITSIFSPPAQQTPKAIEIPEVTPAASSLSNMSSAGTGAKVQLGRADTVKSGRASGGGSGSRARSAAGGFGQGGGLRI